MLSAVMALAFGLSLFTASPLCLVFARKIPPGILPEGAEQYCRRLTAVWCAVLAANAAFTFSLAALSPASVALAWGIAGSPCVVALVFLVEKRVRRRRFTVAFRTSGSTAQPKSIVKTFESLARETALHRERLADVLFEKPMFLSTVEPDHMYGMLWRVLLPQAAGCAVDPDVILAPETLLAKMRSASKVFIVTTPSFLDRFVAYADQYDVPQNAVAITTSGAPLSAATAERAAAVFGCTPFEIFGSTETGGVAWRIQDAGSDGLYSLFPPVRASVDAEGRLVVCSPFSFARSFTMGDAVEMAPGARRFRLLGRRDRIVKVAEQRVSLPEMEDRIKAMPEVRDAALVALDGRHGQILGAVLVPAGECTPDSDSPAERLAWRRRLAPLFPRGAAPRRFRVVKELPRNPQGKVRAEALRELFEADWSVVPEASNVAIGETSWEGDVVFPATAPYFQGHFPGFPVLPGVVMLGVAHHFAEEFNGGRFATKCVKKMKFMQGVQPGEKVHLSIERKGDAGFAYTYRRRGVTCASGLLCC